MCGNISQLISRNIYPTTPILLFRVSFLYFIGQGLAFFGLLSSLCLASSLNFSLSFILNTVGKNNTWHKRMLTTDVKALYVDHEYIVVISLIVFAANLLWLQGEMNRKVLYLIGGGAFLYAMHLLCYSLLLFCTLPNALFFCTEFILILLILYFYVKHRLVK